MIQDIAWSPRFVPSTTATAATDAEAIAGTNTTKFVTPANLAAAAEYAVAQVINPRAARQGLVFDGTAGATMPALSAFGTRSFTISAWVVPTSLASQTTIVDGTSALGLNVNTDGSVSIWDRITSSGLTGTAAGLVQINKWSHIVYSRGTYYVNGVAAGTTTDTSNYTGGLSLVGQNTGGSNRMNGTIGGIQVYNRALSAAEVVALYEAGVPAGSDYNNASNTALNTSSFVNGNSGGVYLYETFSGVSATGFTAVKTQVVTEADVYGANTFSVAKGQRFLITFNCTLTSGTLPQLYLSDWAGSPLYNAAPVITAGANSYIVTATATGTGVRVRFYNPIADQVSYAISNFSITRLGLLLAPDAGQAGGGLTWYDTSGNAANITLPASGVTWNVPFAGYLTAPASTNLTLNSGSSGASFVLGQGTNGGSTLTAVGTGGFTFTQSGNNSQANTTFNSGGAIGVSFDFKRTTASASPGIGLFQLNGYNGSTRSAILEADSDGATDSGRFDFWVKATGGSLTQAMILKSNGRLLLGTGGVDSGALLQVGTDTSTSAGGMVFGTNAFLFRTTTGGIALSDNGTRQTNFYCDSGGSYIGSNDTRSLILRTNNTTALTLDSSQNATFAGSVTISGGSKYFRFTDTAITNTSYNTLSAYAYAQNVFAIGVGSSTGTPSQITITGNTNLVTFGGAVQTAAPASGTAKTWKLGEVANVSPTSPNKTIRVEIDGTVYFIAAKTTND